MSIQMEKLARKYEDFVVFLRVYKGYDEIFNEYNIKSVPTFIFVRHSELLDRRTRNISHIECVIESVKAEDRRLRNLKITRPGGYLYDVKCHDDLKRWLTEARHRLVVLTFLPRQSSRGLFMTPTVQELARKYADTTLFLRIKEEHDDLYDKFNVRKVPTFIFMQNSEKVPVRPATNIKQLTETLDAVLITTTQAPISRIIDISSPLDLQEKFHTAGDKLVILAFMDKWCSKCRKIITKVEEMAELYYGTVVFLKIEDDTFTNEIYTKYKIKHVPSFIFVRNSKKINPFNGTNYENIQTHIEFQDFKIYLNLCMLTKKYFGRCI
ncbi:uncharacterized protein LOC125237143 [Leguminivora glycinivorella]|uniref:uncharacterized protein LOC125237143 n=1 Tax=Leguminivora glycinivorella TaxID=1035111 RepID=UPI0020103F75|nr:uncharacterized protein LOC125237143 [Leguminivora glycinivorella]